MFYCVFLKDFKSCVAQGSLRYFLQQLVPAKFANQKFQIRLQNSVIASAARLNHKLKCLLILFHKLLPLNLNSIFLNSYEPLPIGLRCPRRSSSIIMILLQIPCQILILSHYFQMSRIIFKFYDFPQILVNLNHFLSVTVC